MQNTAKQNYPGLLTFYNTQPGNEVGLFYNAPNPSHRATCVLGKAWKTRAAGVLGSQPTRRSGV